MQTNLVSSTATPVNPVNATIATIPVSGYKNRQCGCFWLLFFISGVLMVLGWLGDLFEGYPNGNIISAIVYIIWGLAMIWTEVEDRGEYLLLTYGPMRWGLCGMGKEKIYFRDIRDYAITRTCFYGFGIGGCSSVKLFNTCSCCCGVNASCFGHKTVRLTINERSQGFGANDPDDCCCESCCLNCCCGDNAEYIGKGCCCQSICNPCNANCCIMNTVYVSTNDPNGLINLLNQKCNQDNKGEVFVTI